MKRGVLVAILLAMGACAHATSLYDEATFRPLTADRKAHRVGDVLTVQVLEDSSASTSADTDTRRKNDLTTQLSHSSRSMQATLAVNGDFDGGGRTQRANRMLTTLSVTVREVLANGDLRVAGEQMLLVNHEEQRVTLEGRVRPQDVSDGNVVLSTRMADARITYLGEGELSERQQRAWWRKLADWMGL
ncbi:MAG TPA: flagellar basal body L-ring protein FlgH [Ramlibacter sp.]|uniref:flagellar basal body L-ring protein FlgH n=1 Tax=Ramlibacter sp. TaxID=1917967 RepID=UPI002B80BA98|nr:flagellar basal body L-ring protein FlgH [Ramlibacter sp.]HVZ46128.1 flagellar basal body L-ring protein FlgH [Ramlibacter sp.]